MVAERHKITPYLSILNTESFPFSHIFFELLLLTFWFKLFSKNTYIAQAVDLLNWIFVNNSSVGISHMPRRASW